MEHIDNKSELQALAKQLGVRPDWHEPDEQGVDVVMKGTKFDNAGFWGETGIASRQELIDQGYAPSQLEKWVVIKKHGKPVAEVNLATLFSLACQ